ncbi:cyclin-dependent kinase regulatory subunit CKS1 [Mrakia frigida]|uniref:cyclin-dependent kinases regulatory subunit n=1 Tax=Mrakia frigida TaxID=29902 RepID=UPI003FCC16D8
MSSKFTQAEKQRAIEKYSDNIQYSARYSDDTHEYRHVTLPKQLVKFLPPGIATEDEWRGCGIRQSAGWEMYLRHEPEPHILMFKRDKDYDAKHPPQ